MLGFIDQAQVDFITNGVGSGEMASNIATGRYTLEPNVGFDPGLLRPVIQTDGQRYCVINTGKEELDKVSGEMVPIREHIPLQRLINNGVLPFTMNASALTYLVWQKIDQSIIKATRTRLQAWNDLAAANSFGGFDGMATTGILKDTMTDAGEAKVDMDTLSDDFNDAPKFQPDILPLPIIHAGVKLSERRLAVSRNSRMPLDTAMIEQSGRRVSETLEKMTIGMIDFSGRTIGSSTDFTNRGIYGYRTQPDRITKTDLTASASFVPDTLLTEVLEMIELARAQNFFGPFTLYFSTTWDQFMARDYVTGTIGQGLVGPTLTMQARLEQIPKIQSVRGLDEFTSTNELLLVQMTSDTVRAVNGMDFTTVQWTENGGAMIMLRVMGIKVPDLRSQYIGTSVVTADRKCAIVHGTTS